MRIQKPQLPVDNDTKMNILIKVYPDYKLYGRIWKKDLKKYQETKDQSLLIYTFCKNEKDKFIPDYLELLKIERREAKEEHLQERLSLGFKGV